MDPRIRNLAKILVRYSIEAQPGEWVRLAGDLAGLPLIQATYAELLDAGANVTLQLGHDSFQELFYKHANDEQLKWVAETDRLLYDKMDGMIYIRALENTRTLNNVPPEKQQIAGIARRPLQETYMRRAAEGALKWVVTQFPTEAYAQEADMSLNEYADFLYRATAADQDNPVDYWQQVRKRQDEIVEWLKGKDEVVVKGPNIDLTLSIRERSFINANGQRNMPDGEIFTGPVEQSVNGWVKFTYPAIRYGREVSGVEFEFREGKVVRAKAQKNEAFLLSQLDSDDGARYLGEFAIGTNYGIQQFTKSILFDEKIGGTVHMAVGAGYPDTGSQNKSSIHWDFICDMREDSEVRVDGELLYKDGQFQI